MHQAKKLKRKNSLIIYIKYNKIIKASKNKQKYTQLLKNRNQRSQELNKKKPKLKAETNKKLGAKVKKQK